MNSHSKLDYIDALRGYAILGVVAVHSLMGKSHVFGSSIIGLGAKGVQLFYLMSAFTLMLSFKNVIDKNKVTLNFFIRRFFRIAPMFYLAIIVWLYLTIDIVYASNDYRNVSMGSIISHFFLLHGLNPNWQDSLVPGGWSVAVESIFYMLCPFFFLKITTLKKASICFIVSLYIGSLLTYLLTYQSFLFPGKEMVGCMGTFLIRLMFFLLVLCYTSCNLNPISKKSKL